MKRPTLSCLAGSLTILMTLSALADNWPNWRGPNMNGVSNEKSLPVKWSDKENVR